MFMLGFLRIFSNLFSRYVNSFEKRVDKFFKHVKSTDSIAGIRARLLELMQENLIVTNVWLEKKYKGYKYLDKSTRKKMYDDVRKIVEKFNSFLLVFQISIDDVKSLLEANDLKVPSGNEDRLLYLASIMAFLEPEKYYHYIKTASFGKLLRDPDQEKLEGDCNQIVTLYIYLFSLKFPIEELQIKLLPEHVCLHFRGIDIEATNATFQNYEKDQEVLPVTEIISTNLLDLADFREEVQKIEPQVMVKSAQLAFAVSSLKSLVSKNLDIAYRNLGISAMNAKDFETAIFYLAKTTDVQTLNGAYNNAAIYYMGQNNFSKATYYADKSHNSELEKTVKHNEGIYYLNNGGVDKALSIFNYLGDEKMQKACYQKKYNKLAGKISGVKTVDDARRYKNTYRDLFDLAQKIGDEALSESLRQTLGKL